MLVDADSGGGSKGEGVPSPVRMFFGGGGKGARMQYGVIIIILEQKVKAVCRLRINLEQNSDLINVHVNNTLDINQGERLNLT